MTNCVRNNIKNIVKGSVCGAIVGSACGAAAGVAGLAQVCAPSLPSDICNTLIKYAGEKAAQTGCGVGVAVGALVCGTLYPAYKGFEGWIYRSNENQSSRSRVEMPENEREEAARQAGWRV